MIKKLLTFLSNLYWKWKIGLSVGDIVLQDKPKSKTHNHVCRVVEIHSKYLQLELLEDIGLLYTKGEHIYCSLDSTTNYTFPPKYIPLTLEQRILNKIKALDKSFEERQKLKKLKKETT